MILVVVEFQIYSLNKQFQYKTELHLRVIRNTTGLVCWLDVWQTLDQHHTSEVFKSSAHVVVNRDGTQGEAPRSHVKYQDGSVML